MTRRNCTLDGAGTMAVHSHAFLPLKCSSNIWAVNGDSLKRPHESYLIYVDDMIMIDQMYQEQLLGMQNAFLWFQDGCLKFYLEKFQLFRKEVLYLRNIVSPDGISTDTEKLIAGYLHWLFLK
jgi:hypothetical protein